MTDKKLKTSAEDIKLDFPLLNNSDSDVVFFDSAASSQKPKSVIDAMIHFYNSQNANVHRGIYRLSESATSSFENARRQLGRFLKIADLDQIIFTSGTTHSLNLVAQSYGSYALSEGDEILLPISEHHSNIVPWEMVARKQKAKLRFIPLDEHRNLDLNAAAAMISEKTKILTFAHISNVTGGIHPVSKLVELAKTAGAVTVCDGAQGAAHGLSHPEELGVDFYALSGHKMCGPTGVGVLYGRRELLEAMPPFFGGGDMIEKVTVEGSTFAGLPAKFEAGTPPIAQVIGLGAAIEYFGGIDLEVALEHERKLGRLIIEGLQNIPGINLHTPDLESWVGIVTFSHPQMHPHDIATILDGKNVCVRAGHHCAQPLMDYWKVSSTVRASPYIYNNERDVELLIEGLLFAKDLLLG